MYQCVNSSKCISIYRLLDGINDCPYSDDEDINRFNKADVIKQTHLKCQASNKYIPQSLIGDGKCDCERMDRDWCEDENLDMNYIRRNISFQTICDGYTELAPIIIDGQNHTDETECQQWLCNNIYTHCDGFWQCSKGEDEIDCYLSPSLNCSSDEHICVSPYTNQLICLSIDKANDGNIDCFGGTDEPNRCYNDSGISRYNNFRCQNTNSRFCVGDYLLCNGKNDCKHGDDEQFCDQNRSLPIGKSACQTTSILLDVEQFLCQNSKYPKKKQIIYFSLDGIGNTVTDQINDIESMKLPFVSLINKTRQQPQQQLRCHRGLDLQLWLTNDSNSRIPICLCPPSYYGEQCQYQNQRVSLSLQFRASSHSWQIPFAIVISLIDSNDDERMIHSYEKFTYLSARDCKIKFNIYLLYSTRPKRASKEYSIHIDIYEKVSLNYRGSLLFPIKFSFLPVHRLAFLINIPRDNNSIESCSNLECNHGKCIKYTNTPDNDTFCQCDQGWSGRYCQVPHTCRCSSDPKCIGVTTDNRSVCVCPLDQFGPRCLLINTACQINGNSICKNGGTCIPNDEFIESNQRYICICPKGFIGKQCEITENQIILSFTKDIILSQSIFIHFIQVMNNDPPRRTTTFKTILLNENSLIIHWPQPFHIVFIELPKKNDYLTIVQKTYNQSIPINKTIGPSNRCQNISEIFNDTILKLHLIRRIKYYQLPCQRQDLNLSCFYDDIHMCLCQQHGKQRVSNCFEFNHNMTFDCLGQSVCENDGQCFQDTPNCPQRSMCICPPCYYGMRCQFSTSGFRISLDAILGYHIQPLLSIPQQSQFVKISAGLAIIFVIVGLLNSILAIITFTNKSVRDVGCGMYLLCTSITTLLITIIFGFKFWILILAQIGMIMNRSFLSFQCHSIDFLLRIGLNMDQWLNACVACERAYTVIQGPKFDKKKSKKIAKLAIIILLIVIIGTNVHDPIYRRLTDEENEDEKRTWCIISYPSRLQTFTYVTTVFHFIIPFLLNLISSILLITSKSRQKSQIQTKQDYTQHLREQLQQHKNLLISPIILILLSLPHLIISFTSKCMKSSNDSWLYLTGYFISFIPPMLTSIIFILPSKFYKTECQKTIARYRQRFRLTL